MKITYFGTTVLLFDDGKDQILFDCHVTRPSFAEFEFSEFETNKELCDDIIKDYDISRLRGIFISHTHYDHVMDAPYFANKCGCPMYGSKSAKNVAIGGNVPEDMFYSYDDSMEYTVGDFHIKVIPSIHSPAYSFNDDLGQIIEEPVIQPATRKEYKEGGSVDFIVKHSGKTYLIRPSYNYLENQLNGIKADYLFQGIIGIAKDDPEHRKNFYKETIEKVKPQMVIPVHWDNFYSPLSEPSKWFAIGLLENLEDSIYEVEGYCMDHGIGYRLPMPLTSFEL